MEKQVPMNAMRDFMQDAPKKYFVMRKLEGVELFAAYYGPFTHRGALRVANRLNGYMPAGTPEQWWVADEAGAKDHDNLGVHALLVKTYETEARKPVKRL